jgi:hypothetical protein
MNQINSPTLRAKSRMVTTSISQPFRTEMLFSRVIKGPPARRV